jgi:DNA-binding NarL/FixJ family response regulator
VIRVWVSVRDPERRAALIRALRTDASVRLVGSEAEADIVCRESEPVALPVALAAVTGERLTARELEVLRLVAEGLDNRVIGRRLDISRSTVKHHLEAIYAKLGVHGRMEAVREGVKRGMVPL